MITAAHKPYTWEPVHPTLAVLAWEDTRTDVHGVVGGQVGRHPNGPGRYSFTCACGFDTGELPSALDASAEIILHAMTTCATCQGKKPSHVAFGPCAGQLDTFPRCSQHAF